MKELESKNNQSYFYYFVLFCFIGLAVHFDIFFHEFINDDSKYIKDYPQLFDRTLFDIFFSSFWGDVNPESSLYRPFTATVLKINSALSQTFFDSVNHPFFFRLTSLLSHIVVSWLLISFIQGIGFNQKVAYFTGLIFLIHPAHIELTNSSFAYSENFAALFGLLFIILREQKRDIIAALCFLLAMFSKESAVCFFPLLLFLRGGKLRLREWGCCIIVVAIWYVMRASSIPSQLVLKTHVLDNPLIMLDHWTRIVTAFYIQAQYWVGYFLPWSILFDYSGASIVPIERDVRLFFVIFVFFVMIYLVYIHKTSRKIILGYAITASITANILFPIGTIMAFRVTYVPSIFICLVIALMLEHLNKFKTLRSCLFLFLAVQTYILSQVWGSHESFWSYHRKFDRDNTKVQMYFSLLHLEKSQYDQANFLIDQALEFAPEDFFTNLIKAKILFDQKKYEKAIPHFLKADLEKPNFHDISFRLAVSYQESSQDQKAIETYRKVIVSRHPDTPHAYHNLALIYERHGHQEEAKKCWEMAKKLKEKKN